jgi:hypothetical protein
MVDKLNTIVLSAAPAGRFLEGILVAAAYPGMVMEIDNAVEPIGGRHSWQMYSGTTGHRAIIAVLLENELTGKTCADVIAAGQRIRMYCPIMADELLMRVSATGTGTGDTLTIGAKVILAQGGTLIANTGSPESEPFQVMETMSDVVASPGTLTHVIFTGF